MSGPRVSEDEITEHAIIWLLAEQRAGTWSDRDDAIESFLTTNQVTHALLRLGYPSTSEQIRASISWLKSQSGRSEITIEDRASLLSTFSLAGERQAADELLLVITPHISSGRYQKPLFPIVILDFLQEFQIDVEPTIVATLWNAVFAMLEPDGTVKRHVHHSSYLAAVLSSATHRRHETAKLRAKILSWLDANYRQINGDYGWERSVTVNAWVVTNLVLMGLQADAQWARKITATAQMLKDQFLGEHWPSDESATKRIRNQYYTTSVALRAICYAAHGRDAISKSTALYLWQRSHSREIALEKRLGRLIQLRRIYPFGVGLGFGLLLGLLVSRLAAGHGLETGVHIVALIISVVIVLAVEIMRIIRREPRA